MNDALNLLYGFTVGADDSVRPPAYFSSLRPSR